MPKYSLIHSANQGFVPANEEIKPIGNPVQKVAGTVWQQLSAFGVFRNNDQSNHSPYLCHQ